ncbi:patatin-like phospholipase family protein [Candidatus Berkiella aquae]|nr:patatin-like phospholipase family protein [Candidatus Berkiella aquae]MCS5710363.1 patatin-like phospholipase family protein [Candidatus Berkiella aquae]
MPLTPPPARPLHKVKVALVLSGGGARALAHAGVIEVLEKNHIPVDLIVGSSAGSIIGALYADEPNADKLREKIIALNKWDLIELNWKSGVKMFWQLRGPVEGNALRCFLQKNMKAYHFDDLHIPLAVVTTDVHHGDAFVIRSGPLVPAIHASSAVPMVFSPVQIYGRTLVDGGVASPVPVEIAKQFQPDIIIAVDIGTNPDHGSVKNAYQLGMRSLHIAYYKLSDWQNKAADIVIHPAVDQFGMFDDHANEHLYQAGQQAAFAALPQIQQLLEAKQIPSKRRPSSTCENERVDFNFVIKCND